MASRIAARYVSRRLSSSGKVLNEEEKAAENVYIKKMEQEKLAKLARKGPKADETPGASSGGSGPETDAKPAGPTSSAPKVSTFDNIDYAVMAGVCALSSAAGFYWGKKKKHQREEEKVEEEDDDDDDDDGDEYEYDYDDNDQWRTQRFCKGGSVDQ